MGDKHFTLLARQVIQGFLHLLEQHLTDCFTFRAGLDGGQQILQGAAIIRVIHKLG